MIDAEPAIRNWLAAQMPGTRFVFEVPPPTAKQRVTYPIVALHRAGGGNVQRFLDEAGVQVDTFAQKDDADPAGASARDPARKLGEQIRDLMMFALPGQVLASGAAAVAGVTCSMAPRELPYTNPNVRRFTAVYTVRLHAAA